MQRHRFPRTPFVLLTVGVFLLTLCAGLFGPSHPAYAELPPEIYVQGIEPPLTATGVFLVTDEAIATALPIGFPFTFYGNAYTQFALSSNGFISFDTLTNAVFSNVSMPTTATPNNLIAAFWDDLAVTSISKKIFYTTTGTAPNRKLVVQWTNTGFYRVSTPLGTFQIILYEGSNVIQV